MFIKTGTQKISFHIKVKSKCLHGTQLLQTEDDIHYNSPSFKSHAKAKSSVSKAAHPKKADRRENCLLKKYTPMPVPNFYISHLIQLINNESFLSHKVPQSVK